MGDDYLGSIFGDADKFDVDGNQLFQGDLVFVLDPGEYSTRDHPYGISSDIKPLNFYTVSEIYSQIPGRVYLHYLDSNGVVQSGAWSANLVRKVLNVEPCRFSPDEDSV